MKKRPVILATVVALLAPLAITLPNATPAVAANHDIAMVADFENPVNTWTREAGTAKVAAGSDRTQGNAALQVTYDVTKEDAYLSTLKTPMPLPSSSLYSSLQVDLKGDGTWNTVYLLLSDASGEIYYYRVDAMGAKTWKTVAVDLTKPPTAVTHGNKNSILDAPLSLIRIAVVRNGAQPAQGTFSIDNIRAVGDGWTKPVATNPVGQKNFVPSAGQTSTISFTAGTPGDYRLEVKDATGLTRHVTGTVTSPQTLSLPWDGKSDTGQYLSGNINGILSYDTTPNGALDPAATVTGGTPFLTGIAARMKASVPSPVGINAALVNNDMVESNRQAKLMEDAYVNYDRESFEWKLIEPRKGYFSWAQTDQAVAIANARNIDLIGRFVYTAPWASSAPAGTSAEDVEYYPPTNNQDYVDYVKATVARYKDSVHTWEVLNEVNTSLYWKPTPDPVAFAKLLQATYKAIKAEDPTATVVAAGLAGFDYEFMEKFRAAGGMSSFDGLGVHTFVDGEFDSSMTGTWLDGAETYLAKYAPGTSLWITETAWSTCEAGQPGCTPVTEEKQAQYLQQAYLDAAKRGAKAITWWNLVEYGPTSGQLDNYGIVEASGREKPAYHALKAVGKALHDATVVGTAAPTADGKSILIDPVDSLSGWRLHNINGGNSKVALSSTAKHSTKAGAVVSYNFSGASTGVELQTNKQIAGEPKALSLWAFGDGSDSPIYMKFTDAAGESFQALVGHSGVNKWKRMTFYLDGQGEDLTSFGGNGDRKVDYPITLKSVFIYKSPVVKQAVGVVHIDDITAHYGAVTRGVVLNGPAGQTQAVYNHSGTTATLAVADSKVTVSNFLQPLQELTASSAGTVAVPLGSMPAYGSHSLGVTAASSAVTKSVTLKWASADQAKAVIQVYTKAGELVRTLRGQTTFDSGQRTEVWDGKNDQGVVAAPGEYKFRITFYDQHGQSTFSEKAFTRTK
jgi:GH35 family endo-1,4-beta-xylanase